MPASSRNSCVRARKYASASLATMPSSTASPKVSRTGLLRSFGTKDASSSRTSSKAGNGVEVSSKNTSASIMWNSRRRSMPWRGLISLRFEPPICVTPKGRRPRKWRRRNGKSTKMPCAVSGRRKPTRADPGPISVWFMRFMGAAVLHALSPQTGHLGASRASSASIAAAGSASALPS